MFTVGTQMRQRLGWASVKLSRLPNMSALYNLERIGLGSLQVDRAFRNSLGENRIKNEDLKRR